MSSRSRVLARRVVVVAVVVAQVTFVVRAYSSAHTEFGFQMFPESSTWQAEIVRVTGDGRRIPIADPWDGYRWSELVTSRGLAHPGYRHHADAGLDSQLAFLDAALDYVAEHTPDDTETRYLEATVTTWHNTDAPTVVVLRSRERSAAPWIASTALRRFDELFGRSVSMRAMALLRLLVGPVVLLHLKPLIDDARHGHIYRDVFYEPYAAWYPELPRSLYVAMLWVAAVAAVAMTLGLVTRVVTAVVFVVVTYDLLLSTTNVHNNRAYLVIVLAALAVTPCGRELSVDSWWRRRRGRPALPTTSPAWPLWLLRFEAATVYGASGLSKLLDPDWRSGSVTWHRLVLVRSRMDASVLPTWAVDVLTDRSFHTFAAKLVIATELFIACGLWWPRTRYAAVWIAICFHVAIQLSADVEVFSYLAIAALVIWSVPATGDRLLVFDPGSTSQRRFAVAVRRLDWLARFRVEPTGDAACRPIRVVDRDGSDVTGNRAIVLTLSRLPLTAWFALPLLLLPSAAPVMVEPAA